MPGKRKGEGIEKSAEYIYQIMSAEKISKFHLVGVSLGAVLVQDFAKLSKLVNIHKSFPRNYPLMIGIYGVDYSKEAVLTSSKEKYKDVESGKVVIQQAGVSSIPFSDDFFDVITAI